jgi:hypothetical protein
MTYAALGELPGTEWMQYPFPLRPDFLARVTLPRDLTKEEAMRLAAYLESLVKP